MPRDIRLDPVTHDILIVEGQISYVEGAERLLQALKIRLKMGLGEWPFDTDAGVAYLQKIAVMPADPHEAQAEVSRVVLQDPEITRIVDMLTAFDYETREWAASGTVATVYGDLPFSL